MNTIGDIFFTEYPDRILGHQTIGFRGRIEVSGDKETIVSYFSDRSKSIPSYYDGVKNSNKDTLELIAILELIPEADRSAEDSELLETLKMAI